MNATPSDSSTAELPAGWVARPPRPEDVAELAELVTAVERRARGTGSADPEAVEMEAVGIGSWTRRQIVVLDPRGRVQAWARVHDRAAGRTGVEITVAGDDAPTQELERVAAGLFAWAAATAVPMIRLRGLPETQLDSGAYAADDRQRRWLGDAGYQQVRTWLQMSRAVSEEDGRPGALPAPRPGVTVRHVRSHPSGLPFAEDLQTVHQLLEESFVDHFNSYRESFPEFVQRLREDPGHRWDHWWIAYVERDGAQLPGGAVVSSVLRPDDHGVEGSYIDYIGVHRRARGSGVAKALLHTVICEAARRGRNRVGLEVDADSPTGADGLYHSLGWQTSYRTESWHRTITADRPAD